MNDRFRVCRTSGGELSSAVGYANNSGGLASSALGALNIASGDFSAALGYDNTASGKAVRRLAISTRRQAASSRRWAMEIQRAAMRVPPSATSIRRLGGGLCLAKLEQTFNGDALLDPERVEPEPALARNTLAFTTDVLASPSARTSRNPALSVLI